VGRLLGGLSKCALHLTGLVQWRLDGIDDGLPRGFRRRRARGRWRAWSPRLPRRRLLPAPDKSNHRPRRDHHRKPVSPPLHRNLLRKKQRVPFFIHNQGPEGPGWALTVKSVEARTSPVSLTTSTLHFPADTALLLQVRTEG